MRLCSCMGAGNSVFVGTANHLTVSSDTMYSNNPAHLSYHKSLDIMEFSMLGESHFGQASKLFIVTPKDMAKYPSTSIKILRKRYLWNHKHDSLKSVNATVLALAAKLTNISQQYRFTKKLNNLSLKYARMKMCFPKRFDVRLDSNQNALFMYFSVLFRSKT